MRRVTSGEQIGERKKKEGRGAFLSKGEKGRKRRTGSLARPQRACAPFVKTTKPRVACRDDFRPEQGLPPSDFVAQGVLVPRVTREEHGSIFGGRGGVSRDRKDRLCRLHPNSSSIERECSLPFASDVNSRKNRSYHRLTR